MWVFTEGCLIKPFHLMENIDSLPSTVLLWPFPSFRVRKVTGLKLPQWGILFISLWEYPRLNLFRKNVSDLQKHHPSFVRSSLCCYDLQVSVHVLQWWGNNTCGRRVTPHSTRNPQVQNLSYTMCHAVHMLSPDDVKIRLISCMSPKSFTRCLLCTNIFDF